LVIIITVARLLLVIGWLVLLFVVSCWLLHCRCRQLSLLARLLAVVIIVSLLPLFTGCCHYCCH
jgi:hypothetical protein